LTTICLVGTVGLGAASVQRIGWAGILATDRRDWAIMLVAGVFNCVAFFLLTKALQMTGLVHVNALNASQAAMAAVAGVLLFHEPLTWPLGSGIALTIIGLLLMKGPASNT
jgi:drug/metabolite transporter (DMT)-like permease